MNEAIEKIREFNRIYLPSMNLLGDHYLGSEYSATEARVFFEIYQNEGCNAAHIVQKVHVDKGYLSRIINKHERLGHIKRKHSTDDSRSYNIFLTDEGRSLAEDLIRKSNEDIGKIISGLSVDEKNRLVDAMDTVLKLIEKGSKSE